MANHKTVYYTFRLLQLEPLMVQAMKWDSMVSEEVPLDTYLVKPDNAGYFGACSCPAYRECKHYKCVQEAKTDGKLDELWKWIWTEKNGWLPVDDIPTVEELL
jgi:hypothetical protein